jgi:hypothetical protein
MEHSQGQMELKEQNTMELLKIELNLAILI